MGKASTEAKQRWINKTYKRLMVSLRYDEDRELLDFIEKNKAKYGTTEIFRAGIEALMEKEKSN